MKSKKTVIFARQLSEKMIDGFMETILEQEPEALNLKHCIVINNVEASRIRKSFILGEIKASFVKGFDLFGKKESNLEIELIDGIIQKIVIIDIY